MIDLGLPAKQKYVTPKEFSEITGLPLTTVYHLCRTGGIPCEVIGKCTRMIPTNALAFEQPKTPEKWSVKEHSKDWRERQAENKRIMEEFAYGKKGRK